MLKLALLLLVFTPLGALQAAAQNCSLAITGPLDFGIYTGAAIRSSTPFFVTCPGGSWYIDLNQGTGAGANEMVRYMTGPRRAKLSYELYQNSAYSINWGNTYPTNTYNGNGNLQAFIYAQLNANQLAPPGTYIDTVSSSTTHFNLTVTILASCAIETNPLAFGTYSGALRDANTTIRVTCTDTTPYKVGLSAGTAVGATVTDRMMTGPGGAHLRYALFKNSSYTSNWGDSGGSELAGTGNGKIQTITVYGQIPAGQLPTPGNYADTVTATVTY